MPPADSIHSAPEVAGEKRLLPVGPMIGKIAGMELYSPITIETTLDPKIQPFLHDHQIDGTPVLPGVMGIEAFAEAALLHAPGWHIESHRRRQFPCAVQVLSERATHGDGRSPDSSAAGQRCGGLPVDWLRPLPNQSGAANNYALHRPRAADEAAARSRDYGAVERTGRITSSKPPIFIVSTSTDRHTRCWSGRGGMGIGSSG